MLTEHAVSHDGLRIESIRRQLWSELFSRHLYVYGEVASTNDVLRNLAKRGAREGTVVLAEGQRAGRGREGKPWFSPPGLNLYMSVLLRPAISSRELPVFAFISSLALTDAIWSEGVPAAIKWPNDVVVGHKKVGGVLVDFAATGDRVDYVVIGVGLNVNVEEAALHSALGEEGAGAGSLCEFAGRALDRNKLAAAWLNLLDKWLETYRVEGPRAVLHARRKRELLTGRRVTIGDATGCHVAHVRGVDKEGRLLVESALGEAHPVIRGEIRLVD